MQFKTAVLQDIRLFRKFMKHQLTENSTLHEHIEELRELLEQQDAALRIVEDKVVALSPQLGAPCEHDYQQHPHLTGAEACSNCGEHRVKSGITDDDDDDDTPMLDIIDMSDNTAEDSYAFRKLLSGMMLGGQGTLPVGGEQGTPPVPSDPPESTIGVEVTVIGEQPRTITRDRQPDGHEDKYILRVVRTRYIKADNITGESIHTIKTRDSAELMYVQYVGLRDKPVSVGLYRMSSFDDKTATFTRLSAIEFDTE